MKPSEGSSEPKPAETKPTEPKPEAPAPVDFAKLELPEGISISPEIAAEAGPLLAELGIGQEGAQKLMAIQAKISQQMADQVRQNWNNMNEAWVKEVKADPEIGGAKFESTITDIGKLLDRTPNGPALREALAVTGAGNNPAILRALHFYSKSFVEPGPVQGSPPKPSASTDAAGVMYPAMRKDT